MPPWGKGPEQHKIRMLGLSYMEEEYPLMDSFEECSVITDANEIALTQNGNVVKPQNVRLRKNYEHGKERLMGNIQSLKTKNVAQQTENDVVIISFLSFLALLSMGMIWNKMRKKELSKLN